MVLLYIRVGSSKIVDYTTETAIYISSVLVIVKMLNYHPSLDTNAMVALNVIYIWKFDKKPAKPNC